MDATAKSFNHKVETLAEDVARWWDSANNCRGARWTCARCKSAPSAVAISFEYVTGKRGRVTDRWQAVCRPCGRKFADKHGLTMPD